MIDTSSSTSLRDFFFHPDHITTSAFVFGLVSFSAFRFFLVSMDSYGRVLDLWLFVGRWLDEEEVFKKGDLSNAEKGSPSNEPEQERKLSDEVKAKMAERSRMIMVEENVKLTSLLNVVVFAYAMSAFATLLAFQPGARVGCSFLTGTAVLSYQASRLIAILHVVKSEFKPDGRRRTYERLILFVIVGARAILAIAAAAVQNGLIRQLRRPFARNVAFCRPRSNLGVGATYSTIDLFLVLYIFGRVLCLAVKSGKEEALSRKLRWRRVITLLLLNRVFARVVTIGIVVMAGFASSLGTRNVAVHWIPSGLALLLLLQAFNPPSIYLPEHIVIKSSEHHRDASDATKSTSPTRAAASAAAGRTSPSRLKPLVTPRMSRFVPARTRAGSEPRRPREGGETTLSYLAAMQSPIREPPSVPLPPIPVRPKTPRPSSDESTSHYSDTSGKKAGGSSAMARLNQFIRRASPVNRERETSTLPTRIEITHPKPARTVQRSNSGFFRPTLSIRTGGSGFGGVGSAVAVADYPDGKETLKK